MASEYDQARSRRPSSSNTKNQEINSSKLNNSFVNLSGMNKPNASSSNATNLFSEINLNIYANTIQRRFSETYYKSLEHQKRPRLVKKCGELNIHMENVPKHKRRLLSDIFNTILDIKWRWHVVIFVLSFLVSWFLFATIWYMIGKLRFFLLIHK